ncbi:MAG: hypothetical protein AAF328_01235 [Planctomycetota bacterium]
MLDFIRLIFLITATLLTGPVAASLDVNVDFASTKSGAAPADTFAAGGQSGRWNLLAPNPGGDFDPLALVDTYGNATGVTLSLEGSPWQLIGGLGRSTSFSGRDDGVTRLMADYIVNFRSVVIEGLDAGPYLLRAYGANHFGEPYPQTIRINENPASDVAYGGVWRGDFLAGGTHAELMVHVGESGRFSLQALDGDPFLNGLQLSSVPEPSMAFFCGGMAVALSRFRSRGP